MNDLDAGVDFIGDAGVDFIGDTGKKIIIVATGSASILDSLLAFLATPTGQAVAMAIVGWATKAIYDGTIAVLRAKGKSDVQKAESALDRAIKTDGSQDDAVAQMALDRAKSSQEFLNKLADQLDAHRVVGTNEKVK